MKKKSNYYEKRKNYGAENVGWATAQLYCKGWRYCVVRKKKNFFFCIVRLYCKEGLRIVENCIAIHWTVLQ